LRALKAIAGEDRVGSPVLEDTHRSGSFRMEGFSVSGVSAAPKVKQAAHGFAANAATCAGARPTAYNKARGLSRC
jgi:hypothetical protein